MNKIYVGTITGCHGIKGELKVISAFEYKNKVFAKDFEVIIDDSIYKITSSRIHKNFNLITLNNINDINKVNHLIHKDIYINKDNLNLKDDEYLLSDLMGVIVMDKDENLGKVTGIILGKMNNFVKVNDSFLIPLIPIYIDHFDKIKKILYTKNGKSLKIS